MDLSTTYLGLKLRTPVVPSASPLSEELDKIKKMEGAGAGAVVLHSLFEEQLEIDAAGSAPEFRVTPRAYVKHIAEAKRAVQIPIIASLNCITLGGWLSYTRQITEVGADALAEHPSNTNRKGSLRLSHRRKRTRHRANGARCNQNPAGREAQSLLQQFCQYGRLA